jgi:dipeptidase
MVIGKLNLKDSKNYMASTNLIKKFKAWSKNKKIKLAGYAKGTVNYAKDFGTNDKTDAIYNRPRMWDGQRILTPSKKPSITKKSYTLFLKPDKKVSPAKVGQVLSSEFKNISINIQVNTNEHILVL